MDDREFRIFEKTIGYVSLLDSGVRAVDHPLADLHRRVHERWEQYGASERSLSTRTSYVWREDHWEQTS